MEILLELDYYDNNQTDAFGNTILHLGSRIGSYNVVQQVLQLRLFDINRQNNFGQTAINCAEIYRKHDIACLLEEAGVRYGSCPREPEDTTRFYATYHDVIPWSEDICRAIVTGAQADEFREADADNREAQEGTGE